MERQITDTSMRQLQWINATYKLYEDIDNWCHKIVAGAKNPSRPKNELMLEDVLSEVEAIAETPESDWEYFAAQFKRYGWLDKLKTIKVLIVDRSSPLKLRVNTHIFLGFSDKSLPVQVKTIYEIDLVKEEVTFLGFRSYTPDAASGSESSGQARKW